MERFGSGRISSQPMVMKPLITVAIPHYKHRRFLEAVLESLFEQEYENFEIVVSDDSSPDDSRQIIPQLLDASGRVYQYFYQEKNLGYDGNVRFCLRAARGRYVLLLGNDDALASPTTLTEIASALAELDFPQVAFTSFEDWQTGQVVRRARSTALLGEGVDCAIEYFRTFSFVSGLIFDQSEALRHETNRWDASVYYQIFLAARILASGGRLASIGVSAVRKDVRVNGQTVENYASRAANFPWSFQSRHSGLDSVIRVTTDGIKSLVPASQQSSLVRRIASQVLRITYPFWLFEYRRTANWSSAVGIARGMWPGKLLKEYKLSFGDALYLWTLYAVVTTLGLIIPTTVFNRLKTNLSDLVRRKQQRPVAIA